MRRWSIRFGQALALPGVLLLAWHLASLQGGAVAYAFVPFADVWRSFLELTAQGELGLHLAASLRTALVGLACGSAAGFLLGVALAQSRLADSAFGPLFHAFRQIPTLGLIPLIALWFGTGAFSIALLVSLAAFEVVGLNTCEGLKGVEARHRELARALCLTPLQTFTRVLLPAAFPQILIGLLQATAFAWTATIGAELLFTVGPGLGVILERAQLAARMDVAIVCLIFIGAMGCATNALCQAIGQRALRWRPTRENAA
jgi:sulfonate transport system permease protein